MTAEARVECVCVCRAHRSCIAFASMVGTWRAEKCHCDSFLFLTFFDPIVWVFVFFFLLVMEFLFKYFVPACSFPFFIIFLGN